MCTLSGLICIAYDLGTKNTYTYDIVNYAIYQITYWLKIRWKTKTSDNTQVSVCTDKELVFQNLEGHNFLSKWWNFIWLVIQVMYYAAVWFVFKSLATMDAAVLWWVVLYVLNR